MNAFANSLLASISAALADGPKQAIPARTNKQFTKRRIQDVVKGINSYFEQEVLKTRSVSLVFVKERTAMYQGDLE